MIFMLYNFVGFTVQIYTSNRTKLQTESINLWGFDGEIYTEVTSFSDNI